MAINPFMIPELSQSGIVPQNIQEQLSQQATKAGTTSSLLGLAFGQDLPTAYTQGVQSAQNIYGTGLDQLFKQSLARQRTNPFASINPEQFTPESVRAFQQSDTSGTGQYDFSLLKKAIDPFQAQVSTNEIAFSLFDKPFRDLTTQERQSVLKQQQAYKREEAMAGAGENAFLRAVGQKEGEYQVKMVTEVVPQAKRNVRELQNALKLIKEGDITTGYGADLMLNLKRVQNFFKSNPELVNQISDTELLNSVLGRDVFKAIGQLGIGARGIDTVGEREFLREVLTGKISLTKETLERLTQDRLERELSGINQFNTDLADGRYKRYMTEFDVPLKPIDIKGGLDAPKVIRYVPDPNNPGQLLREER